MAVVADRTKRKANMHDIELTSRTDISPHAVILRARLMPAKSDGPEEPFSFKPGQWVYLIDSEGFRDDKRAYSLSSTPAMDELEFGIELVPNGLFSARVRRWQVGDHFTIRGPFGTFQLNQPVDYHWLGLSFNAGIVPLVSMIRARLIDAGDTRQRYGLCFGYTDAEYLMYDTELRALAQTHPNFSYEAIAAGSLDPRDLATERLAKQIEWMACHDGGCRAYLAGVGAFIDHVQPLVESAGIGRERILVERYD